MEKRQNLDGKISLDDVLLKAKQNTAAFIEQLENEENGERVESVDAIINSIKADKAATERKKKQFISELKSGLGTEIKTVKGVRERKKTFLEKLTNTFKKLYSKF
jgi:hypothetical protein